MPFVPDQVSPDPTRTSATGGFQPDNPTATSAPTARMFAAAGPISPIKRALAQAGMVGAGATIGQFLGAPAGPMGMSAFGGIGGGLGSLISQFALSEPGNRQVKWGQVLGDAGVSAVPLEGTFGKGALGLAEQGVKMGAANLAAKTAQTGIDEGRLPTADEANTAAITGMAAPIIVKAIDGGTQAAGVAGAKLRGTVEDATLSKWRALGGVVPPTMVKITEQNPGMLNVAGEALAGANLTNTTAIIKNQAATNNAARAYAGLPKNAPLLGVGEDGSPIATAIAQKEKAYEAVAALNPQAASDLQGLREARALSKKYWQAYDRQQMPDLETQAKGYDDLASAYEQGLEQHAQEAGKPKLIDNMRQARTDLAKLYMVDRSIIPGSGYVNARIFGSALNSGKVPLTDEGLTIAKAALTYPKFMQPVTGLEDLGKARIPMAGNAANGAMMSQFYQKNFAGPNYAASRPDLLALYGRNAAAAVGRNDLNQ